MAREFLREWEEAERLARDPERFDEILKLVESVPPGGDLRAVLSLPECRSLIVAATLHRRAEASR